MYDGIFPKEEKNQAIKNCKIDEHYRVTASNNYSSKLIVSFDADD